MPRCEIITRADVVSFSHEHKGSRGRRVTSVIIKRQGELQELASRCVVVCAGTLDSTLIVLAHGGELGLDDAPVNVGTRLHDHLSVPIARVRLSRNQELRNLVAPRFRDGLVIGRRFELKCEQGWGAQGLLHFPVEFGESSPYSEIKKLLLLRQQRASPTTLLRASLPLIPVAPELLRVAVERIFQKRLYLSDDLPVRARLDFESYPHPANALTLVGGRAELAWEITREDEVSYLELVDKATRLLAELARKYGMTVEHLADFNLPSVAIDHLRASATDAYHLGGGLASHNDGGKVVDQALRLTGTENVYVVSSAVIRRPGTVNPTHTLLALAHRFVDQQRSEA